MLHAPTTNMVDTSTQPSAEVPAPSRRDPAQGLERELAKVEGGRKWLRRLAIVGVVGALIGGGVAWRVEHRPPPPPKYMTAPLTNGDVAEVVQSTGSVKPLTEVQVGAQVSGRIAKVFVDFNSMVKKGDVLAEIDPSLFGAAVDQQRAQMAAAEAQKVHAEAAANAAKLVLDRTKALRAENLATDADIDAARGQFDIATADVSSAKAQIVALRAGLMQADANLSYTRIYAPIDGVITNRAIDPGQTVAASFQAPVLFTIAEDLRKMRVLADIDEAEVGKLAEGTNAECTVDAFPGEKFKGTVSQVRYAPNTVSGVVTYQAVVLVDNPDRKLRPGMTATVTVKTKEVTGATKIPNAALRYKPSPERDKDGKVIPKPPEKALEAGTGRVYVLTDDTPGAEKVEPHVVKLGITDGVSTVLADGSLPAGAKVVTDEADDKDKKGGRPF